MVATPVVTVTDSLTLTEDQVIYAMFYWLASVGININLDTVLFNVLDSNWNDGNPTKPTLTISW